MRASEGANIKIHYCFCDKSKPFSTLTEQVNSWQWGDTGVAGESVANQRSGFSCTDKNGPCTYLSTNNQILVYLPLEYCKSVIPLKDIVSPLPANVSAQRLSVVNGKAEAGQSVAMTPWNSEQIIISRHVVEKSHLTAWHHNLSCNAIKWKFWQ